MRRMACLLVLLCGVVACQDWPSQAEDESTFAPRDPDKDKLQKQIEIYNRPHSSRNP